MFIRATAATLLAAGSTLAALPAGAADKAILVLDASGSMWGQIDGRTKIEIARQTLSDVLSNLPDTLELGLVAYGHREKGACGDIETIVEPGPGTRSEIAAATARLNPKGKTPIADSVKRAAEALRYQEDKATVIVITDGIETCNADPCALASELERLGVDFTAHVVGFGLNAREGREVACLAENTGGRYLQAANADELADALAETVLATPAPVPAPEPGPAALATNLSLTVRLSENGPGLPGDGTWTVFPLVDGRPAADPVEHAYGTRFETKLAEGRYLVRLRKDLVTAETTVEAVPDRLTERELVLGAGVLKLSVAADENADPDAGARFDIEAGGKADGGYGEGVFVVPAGPVAVKARLGEARVEEEFDIAPGETLEKKIVAAAGVLGVEAVYAEGGPKVEDGGYRVDILSARTDMAGKRKAVDGGYGPGNRFKLAPGDYLVRVRLSAAVAEMPVTVRKGEMTPVTVVLDAGVLSVKAPGAYRIEILPAKADLAGRRKPIEGAYGEALQITAPPGDYVAVATMGARGGPKKEVQARVTAAERTEIAVE